MLLCPVRGCHMLLTRREGSLVCPRKHSFDVARSGYANLLQPQDRRSKLPGDSAAAVTARRRIHDRGATRPLLHAVARFAPMSSEDIVLDAGCGEGFYLGSMARERGFEAHGVDISTAAIEAAARRYGECEWIVANADRFLPYSDGSFSVVLSITARMNAPEFRRVLSENGHLLVALSAPDDLIELRGKGRDRVDRTVHDFASQFTLIKRQRATAVAALDRAAVEDVLLSIYRPMGSNAAELLPQEAMSLTFSLDLLLFQKKAA